MSWRQRVCMCSNGDCSRRVLQPSKWASEHMGRSVPITTTVHCALKKQAPEVLYTGDVNRMLRGV